MSDPGRSSADVIEGGCLCRAIRYRITGAPVLSLMCHCRTCRRASGTSAVPWLTVERGHFTFLSGEPRSFRSSPNVLRRFCGRCGAPVTYENTAFPETMDITIGSLDTPDAFPPTLETWVEHRLPWQTLDETRRHYANGIDAEQESP